MKKQRLKAQKHVPERTCVACRAKRPKWELARVVHRAVDDVVVDETGKVNGRGAYLCRQRACWQLALKRGALNRALRTTLSPEIVAELTTYALSLPETLGVAEPIQEE